MRAILTITAAAIVFAAIAATADPPAKGPASQPTSRPKIRISFQTTRLTKPLKPDGTVDYAAALNARYGKGVTPENNAAVKIAEAFGPKFFDESVREELIKKLGVKFAEKEKYFHGLADLYEELGYEVLEALYEKPWRSADHPKVAKWLAENKAPLDKIAKASRLPKWFMPSVDSDPLRAPVRLAGLRDVSRAFSVRATLALGEGRLDDALADIQAVRRLGRLVSRDMGIIPRLVATHVLGIADHTTQSLATAGRLSAKQARAILKGRPPLPATFSMVECVNVHDRYETIKLFSNLANDPAKTKGLLDMITSVHAMLGDEGDKEWRSFASATLLDQKRLAGVDWNEVLRLVNNDIDMTVVAMSFRTYAERLAAYKKLHAKDRGEAAGAKATWRELPPAPSEAEWKKSIDAQWVIGACESLFALDFPGWDTEKIPMMARAQILADRVQVNADLTTLAVALAGYRAAEGEYPAKLSALAPGWLKKIPQDFFSVKGFIYKRTAKGYLLYSVGRNARDDDGKDGFASGDIVVRVPPAPTTRPAKR